MVSFSLAEKERLSSRLRGVAPRKYSRPARVRGTLTTLLICSLARLRFIRPRRRLSRSLSRARGSNLAPPTKKRTPNGVLFFVGGEGANCVMYTT